MKTLSTPFQDWLAAQAQGVHFEALLWIVARNRGSGDPEALGLWTGPDARAFTVGGASRTYQGAGTLLDLDPVISGAGLDVRDWRARLPRSADIVRAALRTHDPRGARVELHRVALDRATGAPVEDPLRLWLGTLDELRWPEPAQGAEGAVEIVCVSVARAGTTGITARKSDESQRLRGGDRGRRWGDIAGEVPFTWGGGRVAGGTGWSYAAPVNPGPKGGQR